MLTIRRSAYGEMPGDQQNLAANLESVYQERPRGILEPCVRHHEGARRIGILALVEPHHLTAELLIFRKRFPDVDRRADARQREHTSDGFAMHPDAAVGVGIRMDEPFVESVSGFEFLPISHRITGVRLTGAAAFLF